MPDETRRYSLGNSPDWGEATITGDFSIFEAKGKQLRDDLIADTAAMRKFADDDCDNGQISEEIASNLEALLHSLPGHGYGKFLIIPAGGSW